jgi:O-antigen/teichoic acid export membrane protein
MGIVKKQTIQNSIIQYIGIALGYFNSVILFTNILDTEQYGLTRVLMAISALYVNFSSLGAPKILIKFFPYYKTDDKKHNGLLMFVAVMCLIGFVFATILYLSLKGWITTKYADTTPLFNENYYYVVLLSFLMLGTSVLENFMIAKKETVVPYFLKNIFIRIVWIIEITLYYYQWFDFDTFIFLYVSTYFLNFLALLIFQIIRGDIKLSFEFFKMRKRIIKVLVNYGLFSVITGISNLLVNRIDIIMITFLIGLSSTSVYSIAYYISTVILVPSTAIYRISMPIVSEQWKNKNFKDMLLLYQKSSINQLLIGGLVFLLIWTNIDGLFSYLKPEYAAGKWVVLILSMSVLFNMSMGINNIIVMITKYFRYDTFASISLGILTIIMNLIFIPLYGLEGAAFATLISVVTYQTYKVFLIIVKLKMQPFTQKTLLAILTIVIIYVVVMQIPSITDIILIQIAIKCFVITVMFFSMVYFLKISSDINDEINKYLSIMGIRKSS